jgi:hypothetical protein
LTLKAIARAHPRNLERVAGLRRQKLKILELSASVPLSKGMNLVDVTDYRTGVFRELVAVQIAEKLESNKPAVNVGHAGLDELTELELETSLGDLHLAEIAGPIEHVLEEMPMNGAKMS